MRPEAFAQQGDRAVLLRRGRRLEYFTIGWNALEAAGAIVSGLFAGSIALVGFGFDSVIEVSSGAVLLWWLRSGSDERREQAALRLVGVCFLLLTVYVLFDSARRLWLREAPGESRVGIAIAIASLITMPLLARAKRRVAAGLNSAALHADSRQTEFCFYLSALLLAGLLLNALLGWWWADPAVALAMAPLIAQEGVQALRGRTCCPPSVRYIGHLSP